MSGGATLDVQHDEIRGVAIVRLTGEVDLANADTIGQALASTTTAAVLLDLAGVTYFDSAGIRAVDLCHRQLASRQRSLLIVAPPDSRAAWTFQVASFGKDVVFESVDAALATRATTAS